MDKKITVALTLDDDGGMTFFGKRQSRDRVLISELCDSIPGKIYINNFSSHVFAGHEDKAIISADPIADCPDGGTVFIENLPLAPHADMIERIILYKWNTRYPSDKRIDISFSGYEVEGKKEFAGRSHDKITKLTMRRKM